MAEQKVKQNLKRYGMRKSVNMAYKSKLDGKRYVGGVNKPKAATDQVYSPYKHPD